LKGYPMNEVFFLVVALAVSSIPEGLPVALTVALSVATQRMSKRNVIVRKLTAVESLGSCTYIASDKTGTLTVNQQTIREILTPSGTSFSVSGEGYNDAGEIKDSSDNKVEPGAESALESVIVSGIMCNEAALKKEEEKWRSYGDAMDVAFLSLGYKSGMDPDEVKEKLEVVGEIPYESEKKYAGNFYKKEGELKTAVKGAVEVVVGFCSFMDDGKGGKMPIDKEKIDKQSLELAKKGYRVLGVAGGPVKGSGGEDDLNELIFYGLVGFIDPLRPEAIDAIEKCKTAGIEVAMITGDHPATAFAIAHDLGICESMDEVVTGKDLEDIGDPMSEEFTKKVASSRVFARVSPMQKLQIVDSLIRAGHFVAVTGDGVNDAPALKKANIGVAMGSGTDVAKDTGSMIVTDDNFASIVAGVEEGRYAYDNVRKVIYLLISTGAAEIVLFTLALGFMLAGFLGGTESGLEPPLLAIQLLWLNLVTNGIQGAALAFEGGEPGTMKKPPRKPKEGIFNMLMIQESVVSGIVMALTAFGVWFYLLEVQGLDTHSARNITLLLMVLLENVHVFNCRSESISAFRVKFSNNYFLVIGVIIAQGIHIVSMQIPFMQELLRLQPVSPAEWGIVAAMALILLISMEVFKMIKSKGLKAAGKKV
ncbi:MAG TPA: HAD family hydrolase, partial [Firmicutes bacterium]|nr:HAD family hydrolase [Bacillota bacterium]